MEEDKKHEYEEINAGPGHVGTAAGMVGFASDGTPEVYLRGQALQLAVDLHEGPKSDAKAIVKDAAVFLAFLKGDSTTAV